MPRFDGFRKTGPDADTEDRIARHCEKFGLGPLDAAKMFPVLARRQWLKRFLAHAELFARTVEVPGDIAELGVFRGLGLLTWANLLEAHCIGDRTKVVYGFENWAGFKHLAAEDGGSAPEVDKVVGGYDPASSRDELLSAIEIFDGDRFVPWKKRIELVDGDIETSVAAFVAKNPGLRFSLVHFDCDLYQPTRAALAALWPRVSRGGVVLFDEYALKEWAGETQAVDEFFADKPDVTVRTLPWTNSPAGYVIKP